MPYNDDEDDFEGLSDEEKKEIERQMKKQAQRVQKHPLMLQAKEINAILETLLDTCEDKEVVNRYGSTLRESALIVLAKLHSALASDFYLLCMQNAALIREHAEYLRLSNHSLKLSGSFDEKYVNMFRQEMEKFRLLFRDWAKEIRDLENDYEDEWGLFMK